EVAGRNPCMACEIRLARATLRTAVAQQPAKGALPVVIFLLFCQPHLTHVGTLHRPLRKNITSQVIETCLGKFHSGHGSYTRRICMNTDLAILSERHRGTLAESLGIRFVEASPDR